MMWVISARCRHRLVDVRWSGRCGSLTLGTSRDEHGWTCFVAVVGRHGPHTEDEYHDSNADLTALARSRRRPGPVIVTGDWNVDELPRRASDPWRERRFRDDAHTEHRLLTDSMCAALGIAVKVQDIVLDPPRGPFAEACIEAPISRIPQGASAGREILALLDYTAAEASVIQSVTEDWHLAPAYHSTTTEINKPKKRDDTRMRTWRPDDINMVEKIIKGVC